MFFLFVIDPLNSLQIKENLQQVFSKFLEKGKATICFKEPPHDLFINKVLTAEYAKRSLWFSAWGGWGGGGGLREEKKEGGVKKMIADVLLDDLILINPTNK